MNVHELHAKQIHRVYEAIKGLSTSLTCSICEGPLKGVKRVTDNAGSYHEACYKVKEHVNREMYEAMNCACGRKIATVAEQIGTGCPWCMSEVCIRDQDERYDGRTCYQVAGDTEGSTQCLDCWRQKIWNAVQKENSKDYERDYDQEVKDKELGL